MDIHTFRLTERQAELIHEVVRGQEATLKNWMASAIERGETERAQTLVKELREYQALFACFNMTAKREWATFFNKPMETDHKPKD